MRGLLAVFREAVVSSFTQRATSLVSLAVVVGMCATVLLTVGSVVGTQDSVLASLDDAGTRSIVIHTGQGSGVDPEVLDRLSQISGIQWAAALGPSTEVHNSAIEGGAEVSMRKLWTNRPERLGLSRTDGQSVAVASAAAISRLGLEDGLGAVSDSIGHVEAVRGGLRLPTYLSQMDPLVVVLSEGGGEISDLIVLASEPALVKVDIDLIRSVLGATETKQVSISSGLALASLRGRVEGQLSAGGGELVIVILAASSMLVGGIQLGSVVLRRRDFGRRRALGASRLVIAQIIIFQSSIIALIGAALGIAIALSILAFQQLPLPHAGFIVAVGLVSVMLMTMASTVAGAVAAFRQPATELRVP